MIWWRGLINRFLIRFFDIIFSSAALIVFFIPMMMISLLIMINSKGGVIFSQKRVGKYNTDFKLYKFRSMHVDAEAKGLITIGKKDPRVTGVGSMLRRFKLDELPQLFNVLKGDMSIVGPRPEIRKYTEMYSPAHQMIVLSVRPGITDHASIEFSRENDMLGEMVDPENFYINVVMPAKLKLNMIFIENATIGNYLNIIFKTVARLFIH